MVAAHVKVLLTGLVLAVGRMSSVTAADAVAPTFESTSYTLDTLDHGDTVALAFPFVNRTRDTLILDEVKSRCGCVTTLDGGTRHAPGDGGAVVVTFSSSGQRNGGTYEVAAVFRTPDDTARANAGTVVLSFTVPVRHEVRFLPSSLSGLRDRSGGPPVLTGALLNTADTAITVLAIAADSSSPLEVLTRQLPVVLGRAELLPFVVSLPPGAPTGTRGEIHSRISAVTTNTLYTEHSCDVYLYLD